MPELLLNKMVYSFHLMTLYSLESSLEWKSRCMILSMLEMLKALSLQIEYKNYHRQHLCDHLLYNCKLQSDSQVQRYLNMIDFEFLMY